MIAEILGEISVVENHHVEAVHKKTECKPKQNGENIPDGETFKVDIQANNKNAAQKTKRGSGPWIRREG